MATAIRMPDIGTTVDELTLTGWLINNRPAADSLSRIKETLEIGAFR